VENFELTDLEPKETMERGAALPLVAMAIILLLGMAAFATDLAWFYLNASRIQRAADASALAGVVYVQETWPQVENAAWEVSTSNGYTDQPAGPNYPQVVPAAVTGKANQVQVTITARVPTFFLKVFGINSQLITRTAVAEFVPPLKLGSPSNSFGNDPTCYSSSASCAGNFWANIHGMHTDTRMGDAYSSRCNDGAGSGNSSCAQNPQWRDTGYLYGIIPSGSSFSVQVLDPQFRNEQGGVANGDAQRTGDHNDFCSPAASCPGPRTTFRVYAPDATPTDLSDNGPPLCSTTYDPVAQINPDDNPPFNAANWTGINGWLTACTISGASSGSIYVLQVVMDGSGTGDDGLNRYSLRISPSSAELFGLGDFSLFNNATGTNTQFYLAEVPSFYQGKTFVAELYDPGDVGTAGNIQLLQPDGTVFPSCRQYVRDDNTVGWNLRGTVTPCSFQAFNNGGSNDYNGKWVKLEADLPTSYSCSTCWWKINYVFPGDVNDTTTWRAYMIGNPIHLVP
jgi:hypothetical protein